MSRYILLVVLNLPIILVGLANALTNYKMRHISGAQFAKRMLIWLFALFCVVGAFPIYNLIFGLPLFEINSVSLLDIILTTAVIYLVYITNHQRQRIENTESTLRKLHQEVAIKLADKK